jgi:hypothetical protein
MLAHGIGVLWAPTVTVADVPAAKALAMIATSRRSITQGQTPHLVRHRC